MKRKRMMTKITKAIPKKTRKRKQPKLAPEKHLEP